MGLTFRTGALVDAIYTDSSNKVGIGTSTLTAGIPLSINVATGNNCNVAFQENASDKWYLRNITSSNAFSFYSVAGGAEVMRLSSSGNVGIGTTSPTGTYGKLSVAGGISILDDNNAKLEIGRYSSGAANSYIKIGTNSASLRITNAADSADLVTFTNSGNVGIGTSSPTCTLEVARNNGGSTGGQIALRNSSSSTLNSTTEISFLNDTGASASGTRNGRIISQMENVANGASNMQFWTWSGSTDAERMRITSGGNVLMNTSNVLTSGWLCIAVASNNYNAIVLKDTGTSYSSGNYYQIFTNSNDSIVGSVSHPTSGTTSFNTSSDYRLKEDFKDFNGSDVLSNIKFYDFKWKDDDVRMYGVKAHELDAYVPLAVSGVKDAVDEKGNIIAQGVDYSKIVPVIGKALQEAMAKIEQLEAKVTALENK